jgi:rhomboid protease GluP
MLVYYIIGVLLYFVLLVLCTPNSDNVRSTQKKSFLKRLLQNKGSLLLGVTALLVSAYTLNSHGHLPASVAYEFGLSRNGILEHHWYFQWVTHVFMHSGWIHLLVNINSFVVLSAYERRVGFRRYCTVFLIASIFGSFLEFFLLPEQTVTMGASGGLCGVLAALALDGAELSWGKWASSTATLCLVIFLMGVFGKPSPQTVGNVDHAGHLLGILLGALYTRFFPCGLSAKKLDVIELANTDPSSQDSSV